VEGFVGDETAIEGEVDIIAAVDSNTGLVVGEVPLIIEIKV
jgi:hypothetical protein